MSGPRTTTVACPRLVENFAKGWMPGGAHTYSDTLLHTGQWVCATVAAPAIALPCLEAPAENLVAAALHAVGFLLGILFFGATATITLLQRLMVVASPKIPREWRASSQLCTVEKSVLTQKTIH
jgi:hypothetical protein